MKHLDLFSGIGGFALACRWAGIETIGFSEIDPYCCRVLEKNFPGVKNYGDVRNVPTIRCDLITGGFPCQPFSVAGKRRGADDNRYLWPAMLDVIARCRPTWVLGENVPGIIGMELDRLCADLEGLKFRVQPIVIPACAVDAPHRRDRVWIVAYAESRGQERPVGGISDSQRERPCDSTIGQRLLAGPVSGGQVLADTPSPRRNDAGQHGSGRAPLSARPEQCGELLPDSISTGLEVQQCEHGYDEPQCAPVERNGDERARWPTEPELGRVAHGIPHRVDRLRGLGNSIVPQIAFQILKAMTPGLAL